MNDASPPDEMKRRLDVLGARIERVSGDPDAITQQALFRVARPLVAIAGWRARVRVASLRALSASLRPPSSSEPLLLVAPLPRAALEAAVKELDENVTTIERVSIVRKRPAVAHAAWLRRVWEMLVLAERAVSSLETGAVDEDARRRAGRPDEVMLLPPLGLAPAKSRPDAKHETGAAPEPRAAAELYEVATRDEVPAPDADIRVVELHLAAIDHLLAAARAERGVLGRKRRLLVAARQSLLDAAAALRLERSGVRARSEYIAREIARIDRLETAGLSADAGLVHQARLAISRGDPRRLYAALAAIDAGAVANADGRIARATARGIVTLWGPDDPTSPAAIDASLQRSAIELLGAEVATEVVKAVGDARYAAEMRVMDAGTDGGRAEAKAEVRDHFHEGAELQILRASVAVDGCFEVGGPLSPIRIVEEQQILRQVRHPTQDLVLVPAEDIQDVADAVITDPRSILLDLVAGRLLARRFVRADVIKKTRVVMRSEVRVYLLDGSGSMKGPRARVRDALLVSELATLIARLSSSHGRSETRCTLFYGYFNEALGPIARVDGVAAARGAVRDVVGTARLGGTDIQTALLASFDQIATARELDPDLSRAQIVLVTDGEADVDENAVATARSRVAGVPLGVSIIALGQENAALRAIVARQRARGEPCFYHYLDDEALAAIAMGTLDPGLPIHLPDGPGRTPEVLARELEREIGPIVDELESIEKERDLEALERLDLEVSARREADAAWGGPANEGERARIEALHRDRTALEARFARWFPHALDRAANDQRLSIVASKTDERDDVDAASCALAAVAEVLSLLGGSELARRADAIELLERLLPDARLSPARYRAVLRDYGVALAPALRAVHDVVRGRP